MDHVDSRGKRPKLPWRSRSKTWKSRNDSQIIRGGGCWDGHELILVEARGWWQVAGTKYSCYP
jgi:hypothetical protein